MASRFSPPCVVLRKRLTPTMSMARPIKLTTLPVRGCLALHRAPSWGAPAAESASREQLRGAQTPPASAQSEGLTPWPGNTAPGSELPGARLPRRAWACERGAAAGAADRGRRPQEAGPPDRSPKNHTKVFCFLGCKVLKPFKTPRGCSCRGGEILASHCPVGGWRDFAWLWRGPLTLFYIAVM